MKNFKFTLCVMILMSLFKFSFSQTTIYTQNFGTTGTTFPAGWSQTGGTTGWYINATTVSSGYTGASGGNNVRAGAQTTPDTLNFSSVNTTGYSNITIIWGERRSSATAPSPVLQWSSDSITWAPVTFTDVATNAVWALVNGGTRISLPSGAAGVAKLRLRWMVTIPTGGGSVRIDDFNVQGTQVSSLPPSKISIVSVNGGLNPDSCHQFNVIVQTVDVNGIPSNVTSAANVTLTKFAGNGTGVLSAGNGTIPSGQSSCTIAVTYSRAETGVRLLASCGTLTTDTSSVFTVNPCLATLPSCFAWDTLGGTTEPYPPGWYSYNLGTPNAFGHTAANSGNFNAQGDSLLIHFNTASDTVTFYLATYNVYGGAYQFDVFESPNGLNYTSLHSFTTGLSAYTTWTGYSYTPLSTSRFVKFVYTTQPPAGPGGSSNIVIDDVCIKLAVSVPATAATATPNAICSGSSSTLGVTGGFLAPGANWDWYTGSCGGTYVISGATPVVSPTVNTKYFVRAEGSANTTNCVSVNVYVNNIRPSAAVASPSNICSGVSVTLTEHDGVLVSGANWFWFTGQCGGIQVGSGPSIVLTPTAQTTYFVRGSGACNTTACATVTVLSGAIAPPSPVSATPAAVCPGSSSALSATSVGNTITWWDAVTGGNMLGTAGSGQGFPVTPSVSTTYYAEAGLYIYNAQTFSYTGSPQSFIIPSGLTLVNIDAYGAQGGYHDTTYGKGGLGGRVRTKLTVTPGQTMNIYIGGYGTDTTAGWNGGGCGTGCLATAGDYGGGGGGATDIRIGGSSLGYRIIVAGGGGGGAYYTTNTNSNGGGGGDTIGGNGLRLGVYSATYCGSGGSQTAGGLAGTGYPGATAGTLGVGGASAAGGANGGGGGGGGYYGGGAGISSGAGGGGSSYVTSTGTTSTVHNQGYRSGNGQLIVSWYTSSCVSTRASVTVTINTLATVPTSLTASSSNICTGNSVTLSETGGTLGVGANFNWYSGSCGGTYLNSGASVTQSPTVTTTYWVRAAGPCNTTTCLSITISVTSNTVPTSLNANPSSVCGGISSTISETGGVLVSGSNWNWFTGSCGGTYIASGASLTVTPTVATAYWVRAQGSCNTTSCLSITITISVTSNPTNVTATPSNICPGSPTSLNATSPGNMIAWWTSSSGGNIIGTAASGNNFVVSPTTTTTYYAEAGVYIYNSQLFTYNGSPQSFTIPSGLSRLTLMLTEHKGVTMILLMARVV